MNILRKIYNWTIEKSKHPKAVWFLSLVSFSESSFFPIPPDIILIPMIIAKRTRAWFYAFVCTISSVLGGLFGYCIGYFFYNSIGKIILEYYGLTNQFIIFEEYYLKYGILIVIGAGITPFPYKFITIASGVFGLNVFLFTVVSFFSRGLRFYLLSFLLKFFGEKIEKLIDKYFNILAILFFVLLVAGIVVVKYI
tara:strand:- start:361 stop:945 length:585 start_codon:yes stop_codon:yes gene_type:complete